MPGSGGFALYFVGPKGRLPQITDASDALIQVAPGGATIKAKAYWPAPFWQGVVRLAVDDVSLLGTIAQGSDLTVQASGKSFSMPIPAIDRAIPALKECLDGHAKDWGIDVAALAGLKQRPKVGAPGSWIGVQDYPQDALNATAGGTVVVRLTTDPSGRVTNCVVVDNTGTKSMAEVTCATALKRARFGPAIGSDGKPTAATFISYATFKVFSE